jgi:hypothetical protein
LLASPLFGGPPGGHLFLARLLLLFFFRRKRFIVVLDEAAELAAFQLGDVPVLGIDTEDRARRIPLTFFDALRAGVLFLNFRLLGIEEHRPADDLFRVVIARKGQPDEQGYRDRQPHRICGDTLWTERSTCAAARRGYPVTYLHWRDGRHFTCRWP